MDDKQIRSSLNSVESKLDRICLSSISKYIILDYAKKYCLSIAYCKKSRIGPIGYSLQTLTHRLKLEQNERSSAEDQSSESHNETYIRQPRRHSINFDSTNHPEFPTSSRIEKLPGGSRNHPNGDRGQKRFNFHRLAESATDDKNCGKL